MTATTRIGEGRFATPLELLPGERLLWAGGPALRAAAVHFLRTVVLLVLPALFLAFLFFLPASRDGSDNEDPGRTPSRPSVDCPASAAPPCGRTSPSSAGKSATGSKTPEEIEDQARFRQIALSVVYSIVGLVALFLAGMLVDAVLRVRRAWYVITSERVCIRSGGWSQTLTVIDLDKVVSVQAQSTWFEALLGLQTIELTHAGGGREIRSVYQALIPNPYSLAHVLAKGPLLGELVNHWLPRDNRRTG